MEQTSKYNSAFMSSMFKFATPQSFKGSDFMIDAVKKTSDPLITKMFYFFRIQLLDRERAFPT